MSANTMIEWTDATYNHWEGCTKVGPGCDHCYAETRNARFGGGQAINWGPGAPRRLTSEHNRNNLQRWNRKRFMQCQACGWRGECAAELIGCGACGSIDVNDARRRVFCSSLADVFDNEVPQEWRDAMFAEMEACTNLDFLVLTKRIGNVRKMVPARWLESGSWPSHIRMGATIVNQAEADRDIQKLLALDCPNFLSMEPLLEAVSLRWLPAWPHNPPGTQAQHPSGRTDHLDGLRRIDWVIVGGESGPGARLMHPDWVTSLRDQCAAAGVPFLFKQWGEWRPICQMEEADHDALYKPNVVAKPHEDQDNLNDIYGRRCTVPSAVLHVDGSVHDIAEPMAFRQGAGAMQVFRVGKKAAGRLLDGRTWDGFPT